MTELKTCIGVIGYGFVGKSIVHGFSQDCKIRIYDKYDDRYDTLEDTVNNSKIIFICVPTPVMEDNKQDLFSIRNAIESACMVAKDSKIFIIKSTIIPGTTRVLASENKGHSFIFSPEFLREKTANFDFVHSSRIILGGYPDMDSDFVHTFFQNRFPRTPIYETDWESAELVKYMSNCFLSVKISFLNEIYRMSKHFNINYDNLKDMWLADGRFGESHTSVPGHDGHLGYGGKCFPKDIKAFVHFAESIGVTADVCKSADRINEDIRDHKDWLDIKGATSSNDYGET